jgi:hypothetical protein
MKKYRVDNGNDKYTDIPKSVVHDIIIDHYRNSYHMVFGFAGLIIGFLLAVIAGV